MAREESIEDSLKDLLKCPVCLDINESLKALRCQHTTCLSCLQQFTIRNGRFKCPTCNKEELIPKEGFQLLPDSLLTKQVAEILSRKRTDKVPSATFTSETADCSPTSTDKPASSVSALLAAGGGFGFVPPPKQVLSSSPAAKPKAGSDAEKGSSKKKKKNRGKQAQSQPAYVKPETKKKVDKVKLRDELLKAVKQARGWCRHAEKVVSIYGRDLAALSENSERCAAAVKAYQDKMEKACAKKISSVNERMTFEMETHQKNKKSLEHYITEMENTTQNVASCSEKIKGEQKVTSAAVAEAHKWVMETKILNSQARRFPYGPGSDELIRAGDTMVLMWPSLEGEHLKKFIHGSVGLASVGVFMGLRRDTTSPEAIFLAFPEQNVFTCVRGSAGSISVKRKLPHLGDKVRRKVSSTHHDSRSWSGILVELEMHANSPTEADYRVVVDFHEHGRWSGYYSEIELIPDWRFEPGDKVRVSSRIPEPSRGWGGANGSSVGVVLSLQNTNGEEVIVVNFPECNDWLGIAGDLELFREPIRMDMVQVKLSVPTPKRGWRSVTHEDFGSLAEVSGSVFYGKRTAVVKFPTNNYWECDLSEIEPARYWTPQFEKDSAPQETAPLFTCQQEVFVQGLMARMGWQFD